MSVKYVAVNVSGDKKANSNSAKYRTVQMLLFMFLGLNCGIILIVICLNPQAQIVASKGYIPDLNIDIEKTRNECYNSQKSNFPNIKFLKDISEAESTIDVKNAIFFLQTKCADDGLVWFNARQCCTIESAANWNENRTIIVLFATPSGFTDSKPDKKIQELLSYPNVHFFNLNITTLVAGTPAEQFYRTGGIFRSKFLMVHMSDFLRMLVLHKYGGIYMDLDIVSVRSMDGYTGNFVGKQTYREIDGAVLGLIRNGNVSMELVKGFASDYQYHRWSYNGPELLDRVLERLCGKSVSDMNDINCKAIKVFDVSEFYAIPPSDQPLFEPKYTRWTLNKIRNSTVVHVWNELSKHRKIKKTDEKCAYGILAEANCPKSYTASGEYF